MPELEPAKVLRARPPGGASALDHPQSETQNAGAGPAIMETPHEIDAAHGAHVPVGYRRGMGWRMLLAASVVVAGLGVAFVLARQHRAAAESDLESQTTAAAAAPPPVAVVPVEYCAAHHVIALPGQTRAWYESTIYARVNGYLKKWFVDIGDTVHEGQVLATIETPELDQQLTAALAKVEADKAQIKLAQATAHFTKTTFARYKDAPAGMVSELERDQKDADYQTSLARVTAAESELNSSQAEVDRIHAMLEFKKVTAPFAGTITERHADLGDLVTAGSTANTSSLFVIAQADPMRVFVDVPQQLADAIEDGDNAAVTVPEFAAKTFAGRVARNTRSIDSASRTLRVEVDVPNHDRTLLPGMYVAVAFQTRAQKPALEIPASALNFRSGGAQVAVVSPEGRVTFRNVAITRDMGNVVEIGPGLSAGARVALNISNQILDGDLVQPMETPPPAAPATAPGHIVTTAAETVR